MITTCSLALDLDSQVQRRLATLLGTLPSAFTLPAGFSHEGGKEGEGRASPAVVSGGAEGDADDEQDRGEDIVTLATFHLDICVICQVSS